MIQHLPAVLIIVGTLVVWAFYAMFVVAAVVLAINLLLELLHRLLGRITGGRAMTYEYPLSWPPGFPRTKYRAQSRFDTPEERVRRNLEFQLDLMDATNIVVTTNSELRRDGRPYANQRISDTSVAVYFTRKGREQAIACDKWDSIRDNLQAVAKTIEALRGIDRWGTGEMVDAAFQGFTAIPASASAGIPVRPKRPWYEVLGVSPDAPQEVVEAAGKAMQRKTHPDAGGRDADFQDVQEAIREATQGIR